MWPQVPSVCQGGGAQLKINIMFGGLQFKYDYIGGPQFKYDYIGGPQWWFWGIPDQMWLFWGVVAWKVWDTCSQHFTTTSQHKNFFSIAEAISSVKL